MPMHGFARLLRWHLTAVEYSLENSEIRLCLLDDERTRVYSPRRFELSLRVLLGSTLRVELTTLNTDRTAWTVSQALHSYFSVRQIMDIAVRGLENKPYFDCLSGAIEPGSDTPIAIRSEVDRVYDDASPECVINDPGLGRQIRVGKHGSRSTVVWNPWIEKSRRMPDFEDQEYTRMICVETANTRGDAVALDPGRKHTLTQTICIDMKPKEI